MESAIVIVNYRTANLVCDCLHSLFAGFQAIRSPVIVVDNDSQDSSLELLSKLIHEQGWEKWVKLLPKNSNGGFAAGNNAAIRFLLRQDIPPDCVMLLNPDTIVKTGAVENLVRFLANHPDVGIVGAQLENEYHVRESSARRYPTVLSEFVAGARLGVLSMLLEKKQVALPVKNYAHRCDWVSGAAMMIRSQVFEQIGPMDEGFFLYFEELDFCRRANDAGWQIWLDPVSVVTHFEGKATGFKLRRKRRARYWYDSRRRYFIKHHGVMRWLLADLLWGLGRLSLLLRARLKLGGDISGDPLYYFCDLVWGDLCALLNGEAWRARTPILSQRKSV